MQNSKYNQANIFILLLSTVLLISVSSVPAETGSQLKDKVLDHISRYYPDQFDVSTQNGIVTIKGDVNTLYDKYRIIDIVSRVRGVRDIKDFLNVNTETLPDKMIKDNTVISLDDASSIMEPDRIKVSVNNGTITLDGTVSYYREKEMAETIASWQKGAVALINNIKVLSPNAQTSDANLQIILNEIITKHFPLAKNINIYVKDGIATISGEVPGLSDKYDIEKNFYPVIGIKGIIDNLTVEPDLFF
jgi:osmotically-inducible protein OsmY